MLEEADISGSRAFVDDLLTGGHRWDQYLKRQVSLLRALRDKGWLISAGKAHFGYRKIHALGHVVTPGGVEPSPDKVAAIKRLQEPASLKQLRAFLGLVGFYRRFIPRFAASARPLFQLLKGDATWSWNNLHRETFGKLKEALGDQSWLATPSAEGRFRLYSDFSAEAFGAALH